MTAEESWVPQRADVLIVGGGMGGLAAATAAAEAGAQVVVVRARATYSHSASHFSDSLRTGKQRWHCSIMPTNSFCSSTLNRFPQT